jgi:hypothetical protein
MSGASLRWLAAAFTLLVTLGIVYEAARWADDHWLGERLKDIYGAWTTEEDWSAVELEPLGPLDYGWLALEAGPMRIAHALGAAGSPKANTLDALSDSMAAGLRFFEVDLWLDREGVVQCHHGPAEPAATDDGCTVDALARQRLDGGYFVLDIKTDFDATGSKALAALAARGLVERVIVQLYRPADVAVFKRWSRQYRLPGPIVTTYETHRSLNHVARHAAAAGIQVVAAPLGRAHALGRRPWGMRLLVHPVHDCNTLRIARALGADGFYQTSTLRCDAH